MKALPILAVSAMAVGLAAFSPGCAADPTQGYTTASQYPAGIRTVAVPIWTRDKSVYRRELEFRLTEALIKRIELDTPYKVTTKARADTLLTGSIDSVEQQVLSGNPDTGLPNEKMVIITVSFRWTDLRTGKVLRARQGFTVRAPYVSASPLDEDFFQGSEDVINRLATRVVEQLEEKW